MSTGKLWLCGPASNRAALESAELALRQAGITPCYGPHDLPANHDPDVTARARMARMMDCDAVALIDGWSTDPVASFEQRVAFHLGLKCTALVVLLA